MTINIVNSLATKNEAEIYHLQTQLSGNESAYQSEISDLTMQLTSKNREIYSPKKVEELSQKLQRAQLELSQVQSDLNARIQVLRQVISNKNTITLQLQDAMLDIMGCPLDILLLTDQYAADSSK